MCKPKKDSQELTNIYSEVGEFIELTVQEVKLVIEYAKLAYVSELSELEAERMGEILDLAQYNESLSFLINEIDYFVFQKMHLLNEETLNQYEQQEAKILRYLENTYAFDRRKGENNPLNEQIFYDGGNDFLHRADNLDIYPLDIYPLDIYPIKEYEDSLTVMKGLEKFLINNLLDDLYHENDIFVTITEYYKLAICPELSQLEAERMGEILELAQSNESLSILVNEIDYLVAQELNFLDKDSIHHYENQEARIKEFLPALNAENLIIVNKHIREKYLNDKYLNDEYLNEDINQQKEKLEKQKSEYTDCRDENPKFPKVVRLNLFAKKFHLDKSENANSAGEDAEGEIDYRRTLNKSLYLVDFCVTEQKLQCFALSEIQKRDKDKNTKFLEELEAKLKKLPESRLVFSDAHKHKWFAFSNIQSFDSGYTEANTEDLEPRCSFVKAKALRERICIFHFSGHGHFCEAIFKEGTNQEVVGSDSQNNPNISNIMFNVVYNWNVSGSSIKGNLIPSVPTKSNPVINPDIKQELFIKLYQERLRQARRSFNLTLGLTATSVLAGLTGILLLFSGNITAGAITALGGGIYGSTVISFWKHSKDANDRLDKVARELNSNYF